MFQRENRKHRKARWKKEERRKTLEDFIAGRSIPALIESIVMTTSASKGEKEKSEKVRRKGGIRVEHRDSYRSAA